jgi:hypothetical protein
MKNFTRKCASCGDTEGLHDHHLIPILRQGGDRKNITFTETIPMCHDCHLYMEPVLRRVGSNGWKSYSVKQANKIVAGLRRNTKYVFNVKVYHETYKTVRAKDFVTIELCESSKKKLGWWNK